MPNPMQDLTDQDKEKLRADFVVPLIVGKMLAGVEPLDEVAEYTVHDIVGDMKPDCGLLCVALCAEEIARRYPAHLSAGILALEAERLVEEFGGLWIGQMRGVEADIQVVRASLVHIPEDLESLADLLDATQADLPEGDIVGRTLCDMMALQARVHAESATEELHNISLMPLPRAAVAQGKVIPFPRRV